MLTYPFGSKPTIPAINKRTSRKANAMLHHQAFDNSLQANIIFTVGSGKIILANSAACKLLGYSNRELLTKTRSAIFDIKESGFKKMLKQRMSDGHSTAYVIALKKNNKPVLCEVTSAVFTDAGGIERSVTTIADRSKNILLQKDIDVKNKKIVAANIVLAKSKQKKIDVKNKKIVAADIVLAKSKQKKVDVENEKIVADNIITALARSDARQKENTEWIKLMGKTSYDIMWDWDIVSGKIYVGDSIKEVFGYNIPNNTVTFKDFTWCLLPEEKDRVEKKLLKTLSSNHKSWKDSFMFKRCDGSIASSVGRASIIRDRDKKATRLIGAILDVSGVRELEEKLDVQMVIQKKLLTEFKESFDFIINSSSDVLYDSDLLAGKIIISDNYEKEYAYKINSTMTVGKDWASHIHPEDKETVMQDYRRVLASEDIRWSYTYRFLRADNSVANVISTALILRDSNGKAYRMIGSMQDISKQKVLEEKLEQEIRLKEKQIEEAMEDAKSAERSELGRELHDNVNQLLGASKLFLDMAKRGGQNSEMCLSRSSEYTLMAIEEIRKLTKGLTTDTIKSLGLVEAIENISSNIMEASPLKISCSVNNFIDDSVNDQFKLNVFRIVQEQLNNILKHAKATEATINLSQNKKSIILSISDNGVGFDTNKKRMGIGVMNIKSRAASYHGSADIVSHSGQGCVLCVTFPASGVLNKIEKPGP